MRRLLFSLGLAAALGLVGTRARAGAADAGLDCSTPDGAKLSGVIPRDGLEFALALVDEDGRTASWSDTDHLVIVSHVLQHVLVFQTTAGPPLSFRALPKTMKSKGKRNRETASFDALAVVPDLAHEGSTRELRMTCSYIYEI